MSPLPPILTKMRQAARSDSLAGAFAFLLATIAIASVTVAVAGVVDWLESGHFYPRILQALGVASGFVVGVAAMLGWRTAIVLRRAPQAVAGNLATQSAASTASQRALSRLAAAIIGFAAFTVFGPELFLTLQYDHYFGRATVGELFGNLQPKMPFPLTSRPQGDSLPPEYEVKREKGDGKMATSWYSCGSRGRFLLLGFDRHYRLMIVRVCAPRRFLAHLINRA